MTATTWDTNLKSAAGLALSGGNLTATATAAASVAATRACSDLTYGQVTLGSSIATAQLVGLINRNFPFGTTLLGADSVSGSIGWKSSDGTVKINNATVATIATGAANAVVDWVYYPKGRLFWLRVNNGNWNNDVIGNQNPVGFVGGISTAAIAAPLYPAWGAAATGNNATAIFTSGFTNTAPTGYVTIDTLTLAAVVDGDRNNKTDTDPQMTSAKSVTPGTPKQDCKWSASKYASKFWSRAATATTVSGIVKENGAPVSGKTVRLYGRAKGEFLGEATSDGSGAYSIPALGRLSTVVQFLDSPYNGIILDAVTPG